MSVVTVKIENVYDDGHESTIEVELPEPTLATIDDWWNDVVLPHTGDGYGAEHPKLGFWYEATITTAEDTSLCGLTMEWDG
jgi:hypothetical protein